MILFTIFSYKEFIFHDVHNISSQRYNVMDRGGLMKWKNW